MDWQTALVLAAGLAAGGAAGALLAARLMRSAASRAREPARQALPSPAGTGQTATGADPDGPGEAERLAYVGRLAGGLVHEIKNPLSTLNLNLELLAEDLAAPGDDAARRAARKIQVLKEEAKRLEDILDKFMVFVGRMELKKARLDPGEVVRDLLEFYEPQAAQRRLTVRAAIEAGLPPVEADADLLKQALLNLILNAQAATGEGGELLIGVRREGSQVAISVTDTGSGIAPQDLPHVFEAYYSRRRGGLGLGLPIVQRIVAEHGGTIEAASELGRGTQMTIRLPPAAPADGQPPAEN